MILQHSSYCGLPPLPTTSVFDQSRKKNNLILHKQLSFLRLPNTKTATFKISCLGPGLFDQIAQLAQNKVLIAAGASAAIGQFSKPFTSVLLYGKDFDLKRIIEAGGFPSTHSSATVASATYIGLERGFSDPIFGLTVVYAGLIMYDAQGVRREVGIHAKTLNKVLRRKQLNSLNSNDLNGLINSQPAISTPVKVDDGLDNPLSTQEASLESQYRNAGLLVKEENKTKQNDGKLLSSSFFVDAEELSQLAADGLVPLKESIGHTEVEVIAGALLGLVVGFAVYNYL
ncbi:hypothetical protein L6164_022928 [Bauhinia variegata]|uniref:Uncharacterized protein n=1 Tax=Bauhinia variegata TaxID=167791 RepID=A0ACB9MI07_BAUVA|nr:hypothetical protein L6164_022928 [Bauhinia variegata]